MVQATHTLPQAPTGLGGVYVAVNALNGKLYVGSTQKFKTRFAVHLRLLRRGAHHSWKLQRDFDVFGESAFTFKPLLVCAESDLAFYEQRAIAAFGAVETGYNVSLDTEAPMRGRKHSDASKVKMGEAHAGTKQDAEWVERKVGHRRGVPLAEDHIAKIKKGWETRRLTPVSMETRKKLSEAGMGRGVSEKSLQALVARNKAQAGIKKGPMNLSDAERQRRIDANKARTGKVFEGEQAEDLKAKKQAAWADRKARGLHTRRWYVNRGLEVPSDLSTSETPCEAVASNPTSDSRREIDNVEL